MNDSALVPKEVDDDAEKASMGRLHWIDTFRGLALMMVLVDHLDMFTGGRAVIRTWTLMGLGYSDAAEIFAFLSGISFGWVYEKRMNERGFWDCQWRIVKRTLLIYGAFVVLGQLTLCLAPFAPIFRNSSDGARIQIFYFAYQPVGLGILAMYVAVVPFLPGWLALYRKLPWLAVIVSLGLHGLTQLVPDFFGGQGSASFWYFLPLAWQLLIMLGVIVGVEMRRGRLSVPRSAWLATAGGLILLAALSVKKGDWLGIENFTVGTSFYQTNATTIHWLEDKSSLGWLRLVHFFALVYVIWYACSNRVVDWENRWLRPLIICGRQSLVSYGVGHLLICAVVLLMGYPLSDPWLLLILAFDVCALQALIVRAITGGDLRARAIGGIFRPKGVDPATK